MEGEAMKEGRSSLVTLGVLYVQSPLVKQNHTRLKHIKHQQLEKALTEEEQKEGNKT